MLVHIRPPILKPVVLPLLKVVVVLRPRSVLFLFLLQANHLPSDSFVGHEMLGEFFPDLVNAGVMRVVERLVLEVRLVSVGQVADEELPLKV